MSEKPELDAILLREPADILGYLAYGEWLKERGDPWGELIEAQVEAHEAGLEQDEGELITGLRARVIEDLLRRWPCLEDVSLDPDELELWWGFADIVDMQSAPHEALQALADPFYQLTTCLDLYEAGLEDIRPLAPLKRLKELDLGETKVRDLSPLTGLVHLVELNLTETRVTDLGPLAGCTSLATLDLDNAPVSDLSPLAGLVKLEDLNLPATRVRDLRPLMGLKNLSDLVLCDTEVDEAQVEALQQALPDLDIEY